MSKIPILLIRGERREQAYLLSSERGNTEAVILGTAGRLGIEPRFTASKAAVLPLDDLPAVPTIRPNSYFITLLSGFVRKKLKDGELKGERGDGRVAGAGRGVEERFKGKVSEF